MGHEFLIAIALWCGNPPHYSLYSKVDKCRQEIMNCYLNDNSDKVIAKIQSDCIIKQKLEIK